MLHSGNLDFFFPGKTAVLTQARKLGDDLEARKADLAASTQAAIVDVLVKKSLTALQETGLQRIVVAGGVGANRLREQLDAACAKRRVQCALPRTAPVHRQRRHDRPGRRHAPAGRAARGGVRLRLRCQATLALERYSERVNRRGADQQLPRKGRPAALVASPFPAIAERRGKARSATGGCYVFLTRSSSSTMRHTAPTVMSAVGQVERREFF